MTPFQKATISGGGLTPAEKAQLAEQAGCTVADVDAVMAQVRAEADIWLNDTYQVDRRRVIIDETPWVHLSIKRIDKDSIHDWRDLQQIKNELVGPEYEAIELYPAESRLVDTANQYHLWVCPDPAYRFPLGWNQRLVMDHTEGGNTRQRAFTKE